MIGTGEWQALGKERRWRISCSSPPKPSKVNSPDSRMRWRFWRLRTLMRTTQHFILQIKLYPSFESAALGNCERQRSRRLSAPRSAMTQSKASGEKASVAETESTVAKDTFAIQVLRRFRLTVFGTTLKIRGNKFEGPKKALIQDWRISLLTTVIHLIPSKCDPHFKIQRFG